MTVKLTNENEKKLKIGETIKQTFYIYITGFKQFMFLSVIAILTSLTIAAAEAILPISVAIGILVIILSIFLLYFTFRANAGFFLLTQNILRGERPNGKESFRQTKGYAGTYFSISLLYALILILPIIGIGFSYGLISNVWIKYGTIGLLLIPLLFLATRYSLAVASSLFADSGGLESSKLLVKGDFWQVLFIMIFFQGITLGLSQAFAAGTKGLHGFWPVIIAAFAAQVIQVLAAPISGITPSVMYHTLNEVKGVDALPFNNAEQNIAPVLQENIEMPDRTSES